MTPEQDRSLHNADTSDFLEDEPLPIITDNKRDVQLKRKESVRPTKMTKLFGGLFLKNDNKSFNEPENLNKISGISIDGENVNS